jgi:hypothetical protein
MRTAQIPHSAPADSLTHLGDGLGIISGLGLTVGLASGVGLGIGEGLTVGFGVGLPSGLGLTVGLGFAFMSWGSTVPSGEGVSVLHDSIQPS